MIIKEVTLEGFGKYSQETNFRFGPGLNVIVGPNEAGKTTLMNAIRVAFFGQKSHHDRWASRGWQGESVVAVRYRIEDGTEYLLRRVMPGDVTLYTEEGKVAGSSTTHKKLALAHLGLGDEKLFANTLYVGAGELETAWDSRETKALRDRLESILTGGDDTSATKALASLDSMIRKIGGAPSYEGRGGEVGRLEEDLRMLGARLAETTTAMHQLEERRRALRQVEDSLTEEKADVALLEPMVGRIRRREEIEGQLKALEDEKRELDLRLGKLTAARKAVEEARWAVDTYAALRELGPDAAHQAAFLEAEVARLDTDQPRSPGAPRLSGLVVAAVLLGSALGALYFRQWVAATVLVSAGLALGLWAYVGGRATETETGQNDFRAKLDALLSRAGVSDASTLRREYGLLQAGEKQLEHREGILAGLLESGTDDELMRRRSELLDEAYQRESALRDLEGQLPAKVDSLEAAKNVARLDEAGSRVTRLREKAIALRAGIEATPVLDPVSLQEEIEYRQATLVRLNEQLAALNLASGELRASLAELQEDFVPGISRSASQYLNRLSGGRYEELALDDELNVKVKAGASWEAPDFLSNGTFDQLYVALRVAVADALSGGGAPPLMMDDPFVYFDAQRLENARETVAHLAETRQVFLFSHDERYTAWGGRHISIDRDQ